MADAVPGGADGIYDGTVAQEAALRKEAEKAPPVGRMALLNAPAEGAASADFFASEFEEGSEFRKKLANLVTPPEHHAGGGLKYTRIRATRRDGNCFYRSYLFGLFQSISK